MHIYITYLFFIFSILFKEQCFASIGKKTKRIRLQFSSKCKTVTGESAWALPANHSYNSVPPAYRLSSYTDMYSHVKHTKMFHLTSWIRTQWTVESSLKLRTAVWQWARLCTHNSTGWARDGGLKSFTWKTVSMLPFQMRTYWMKVSILKTSDREYVRVLFAANLVIVPNLSFSIKICCNIWLCFIAYKPPVSHFLLPGLKSCQAILSKLLTTGQDCTCCLATLAYWRTFCTHSAPQSQSTVNSMSNK